MDKDISNDVKIDNISTTPVRIKGKSYMTTWENTFLSFQEFEKSLECKICYKILEDPVSFGMCEHSFCRTCSISHVGKACPLCFTPADVKDTQDDYHLSTLVSLSHQLRNLLTTDVQKYTQSEECDVDIELCNNSENNLIHGVLLSDLTEIQENVNDKLEIQSHQCTETEINLPNDENKHSDDIFQKDERKCTLENQNTKQKTLKYSHSEDSTAISGFTPKRRLSAADSITAIVRKEKNILTPTQHGRTRNSSVEKRKDFPSPAHKIKRNAKGETPLHIASIKGDVAAVSELLESGVNPNIKDNAGWTPLHEACNHGHKEIVELLLGNGALINIPGCDNETPLHDAVLNNRVEVVKILVAGGADLNVRNSRGLTPLQLNQTEEMKAALLQTSPLSLASSPSVTVKENLPCKEKIVIVATGLNNAQKNLLQKCATMLKANIAHDFSPEVTHVVTVCDEAGHCSRTLKFLYGIISAKWIVNFNWVELCLEYKQKIPEEVFEVQGTTQQPDTKGPMMSRINAENQFPPLFDGCKFYFIGNFMPPAPPRGLLMILIRMGGGVVLAREPKPSVLAAEQCVVPYHVPQETPLAEVSYFIVYQGPCPRHFTVEGPVCCVSVFWLLDCIGAFKIFPLREE